MDLWFEKKFKPRQRGDCRLFRYADDFVVVFARRHEAEAFAKELKERLAKLSGTWKYYGLIGNSERMQLFYTLT